MGTVVGKFDRCVYFENRKNLSEYYDAFTVLWENVNIQLLLKTFVFSTTLFETVTMGG